MKDKLAGYSIFTFSLLTLGAWVTFTIWGIIDWTTNSFMPQIATVALLAGPIVLAMIVVFIIINSFSKKPYL